MGLITGELGNMLRSITWSADLADLTDEQLDKLYDAFDGIDYSVCKQIGQWMEYKKAENI